MTNFSFNVVLCKLAPYPNSIIYIYSYASALRWTYAHTISNSKHIFLFNIQKKVKIKKIKKKTATTKAKEKTNQINVSCKPHYRGRVHVELFVCTLTNNPPKYARVCNLPCQTIPGGRKKIVFTTYLVKYWTSNSRSEMFIFYYGFFLL